MRRQAGWHSDREEAAFRLLQLVDFDENVGLRTVVDVATETGCIQIAHAVGMTSDRVRLRSTTPSTVRERPARWRRRRRPPGCCGVGPCVVAPAAPAASMALPTVRTLQRLAAEKGIRLDTLEKVLRFLELLDEVAQDPVLSQRLALKGGTALNVFYLDLDRLSVDIDLNYVGVQDLAAMERERPEVDAAIDRLFASHGAGVRRRPTGHAGGKWLARYASALGGNASLELDLNDMARQPLSARPAWSRIFSAASGREDGRPVPILMRRKPRRA